MSSWAIACVLSFTCFAILYIGRRYYRTGKYQSPLPLPPGPPGIPWVGNVIGINVSAPWLTYADWSKKYGDLVHGRLLGRDIIIINSEKIAKELLENRSKTYSDRPYLITNELCGVGFNSVMMRYGDRWRLHRRFFHQAFRLDGVFRFAPAQHRKSCVLLQRLLDAPERLSEHVFTYTASVVMNSVYDYDPIPQKDELLDILARVLDVIQSTVTPGLAIVVGTFPALLYLPSWLPGMGFKNRMEDAKELTKQYVERPFSHCLQKTPRDDMPSSLVNIALHDVEEKGASPDESWMRHLKEAAATAFLAAAETTNSVLMTFFLLMMANPDVQKKAQEQIDAVIGRTGLPTIDDRASLPYIDAILREVFRFRPAVPLSVPHATVDDDVYNGYHIPKGAMVMVNVWSITRDENRFPNPDVFLPERFLDDDGSLKAYDIEGISFGFGRRICAGRHFADTSVWSLFAKVLAVFTILRPIDENGAEIIVEPKFSSGLSIHPLPFQCRIVPRIPGMDVKTLEELIAASGNQ